MEFSNQKKAALFLGGGEGGRVKETLDLSLILEGCLPEVFGRSKQLSLNKFFDPNTPSMRKGRDGGKKKTGEKNGWKKSKKKGKDG